MPRDILLFLGNPGSGKSTLVNCLAGKHMFKSGISFGAGLTAQLNEEECNGITYMDTPGLSDRKLEDKAAEAITEALKKTGKYRIFFMVGTNDGRPVNADLETVQRVMDAIKVDEHPPFSIIINKISKRIMALLDKTSPDFNEKSLTELTAVIYGCPHKPSNIFLLKKIKELSHKNNVLVQLPQPFIDFVGNAPSVEILDQNAIRSISTSAEIKEQYKDAIADVIKYMEIAENAQRSSEAASRRLAEANAKAQRASEEASRRLAEANANAQRASEEASRRLAEANANAQRASEETSRRLAEANAETIKHLKSAAKAQHASQKKSEHLAEAHAEAMKHNYGNGVSVKFIINNDTNHTMKKDSVKITSGKDEDDSDVEFPETINPFESAAAFHAKRDASAYGCEGEMKFKIDKVKFLISWDQPYRGRFGSKVTVDSDDFTISKCERNANTGTSTLVVNVTEKNPAIA